MTVPSLSIRYGCTFSLKAFSKDSEMTARSGMDGSFNLWDKKEFSRHKISRYSLTGEIYAFIVDKVTRAEAKSFILCFYVSP